MQARVEQFVQDCQHLANMTNGNDIMLTMGTDFTYSNAWPWSASAVLPAELHACQFCSTPLRPIQSFAECLTYKCNEIALSCDPAYACLRQAVPCT